MRPGDGPFPNDFPDLTLPKRADQPATPSSPASRPAANWKVGERILAPWEPTFLYVGRIKQIEASEALIEFEDGDAGWVTLDQIRRLAVQRGQKVLCRRKMGPHFYAGQIVEVRGDEVCVVDEGGQEEWTRITALRIPCQALGRGATPTKVASHQAYLERLQPSDRVWAPWSSSTLFAGTIDQISGKEAHIHFDDGDRGWVQLEQVVPLQIPVGLEVGARRKMGRQYLPAVVAEVQGERILVQFQDGGSEWTRPAALVIPCQPFGPDARPSGTSRASGSLGWLIPIAIGVGLVFLRTACR